MHDSLTDTSAQSIIGINFICSLTCTWHSIKCPLCSVMKHPRQTLHGNIIHSRVYGACKRKCTSIPEKSALFVLCALHTQFININIKYPSIFSLFKITPNSSNTQGTFAITILDDDWRSIWNWGLMENSSGIFNLLNTTIDEGSYAFYVLMKKKGGSYFKEKWVHFGKFLSYSMKPHNYLYITIAYILICALF